MSRAGTPTDNRYAERFVGLFKLAVAERRPYQTLGEFFREFAFSPSTHLDLNKTGWYNAAQRWADPPKMEGRMA